MASRIVFSRHAGLEQSWPFVPGRLEERLTSMGELDVVTAARDLPLGELVSLAGVSAIALFFPSSHATRLTANGIAGEALFAHAGWSILVLALWAVAGYALLLWRLSRRES